MKTFNKITIGFVIQRFDKETCKCISQEFVAGDDVSYEDEAGELIEAPATEQYYPFDMIQPQ